MSYFVGTNVMTDNGYDNDKRPVVKITTVVTTTSHTSTFSKPNILHNQLYEHEHIPSLTSGNTMKSAEKFNPQDKQTMSLKDDFNSIKNASNLPMKDKQSVENYGLR